MKVKSAVQIEQLHHCEYMKNYGFKNVKKEPIHLIKNRKFVEIYACDIYDIADIQNAINKEKVLIIPIVNPNWDSLIIYKSDYYLISF